MPATNYLKPENVALEKDAHNNVWLKVRSDGDWERIGPVRAKLAFPLTDPGHYVTFEAEGEGTVGTLEDYRRLDPDSLWILTETIEKQYFIPRIVAIEDIQEENHIMYWKVRTERGPRSFEVTRRNDIRWLDDRHIVIRDADGNKYEIKDYHELDKKSRAILEAEV